MRNRDKAEAKVRKVLHAWRWQGEDADRYGKRLLSARKRCSCHYCGNPRRWDGRKTLQERKADDAYGEMLHDITI